MEVYILAQAGADLSKVVKVIETRPFPDGELVVATVKPDMITKMASHPGVVAAEVFHAIEAPIPKTPVEEQPERQDISSLREKLGKPERNRSSNVEETGLNVSESERSILPAGPSSATSTDDWEGVGLIGAPAAWDKGFKGEGVNVAIVDSGVDFGHPDLENQIAFYDSGPYDGWPIALDPRSMRAYYYNGTTSWDNFETNGDRSWYAGVYDVIVCTAGKEASFNFNEETFTIDADITSMSLSGEIRWGVHPDREFAVTIYDWVPFILVDSQTSGVYDTVIADMNFDQVFDSHDDTAVLGTDDPVLNQDLGHYIYTDTLVMTGTQYVPASWFEMQLPPYWYGWDYATEPITLTAGAWIYALDAYSGPDATDGADGIPDVSGGMVYYIADGERPIPGMDYLYPGFGPSGASPIPLNGQIVAFMLGSRLAPNGGDHGTLCASAAVAAGQITGYYAATGEWVQYAIEDYADWPFNIGDPGQSMDWLKPADVGTVQGPAPAARIIALGNNYAVVNGMQGFYDSYTFLAYGVDGVPNSGDEFVQVASLSYGDGSVNNDGWDWESRLLSYYNKNYLPNTTFTASSGNGGWGFGTINSPQGDTTVSVGASSKYGASTVFGSALTADQLLNGDVASFSGRGPDALGRPDPDVLATGAWGAGDTPLNAAVYDAYEVSWFVGDGNNAWYEWGGTSRSSPEAAGVMALVYQAYKEANGVFPDYETARQILMSGADDMNHDVLMQGAGRVNADRATDVAGGLEGVFVTPSLLAAGEYKGTQYESFPNILFPGDTWSQTFTVNNTGATDKSVSVGDEVLMEMSTITYTQVVSPYLGHEGPYPQTYYYWADYFVGADPMTTTHGADLTIPVPEGADFMQVQLTVPFEIFDFSYQDPDPSTISYSASQRWSLTVYDWTDRNGDGILWEDTNADGVVSYNFGDIIEVSATGQVTQTEVNRFSYGYNYANEEEVTVSLADRETDNILIGLVHRNPNNTRPGWGAEEYQANPFTIKVIFYQKMDWDLVEESASTLNIPGGDVATFDATFTIPADQPTGLYEGAITVDDGTHLSIIPTTVNVAVPSSEMLFSLGGTPASGTPYDNGRMTGGYTWSGAYEEGDWRFYFYDADAGMQQQYLYVKNQWGELCGNMPTFNDTLVWGPNMGDQFSMKDPATYGPYGNQFAGGTFLADTYTGGAPRQGDWYQNGDGIALPESRAFASLWDGLNQVQFRNTLLSGKHYCGEGFDATAGVFGVDAPENGIYIETDQLSGSFDLNTVSPVDGLIAYASGFGQQQFFSNQIVPQGKHPDEVPPPDLLDGWVYTFDANNLSAFEITTQGPGSSDIDLYLLYDANNDGFFNPYDNREYLYVSRNYGPWEDIFYSGDFNNGYNVQNGKYAVVMYGDYIEPGDEFDLKLTLYGGDQLNIAGSTAENNYVIDASPGESQSLQVNWTVPGAGMWYGFLWFATPWDEEGMYHYMGPGIYVPVFINKEAATVSIEKDVSQEMVDLGDIITYTIKIKNGGVGLVYLDMTDVLPMGLGFYPGYGNDGPADLVDGYPDYSGITSTLATEIPDFFASNCDMWYDEWMRTVHYSCQLPINYEGKMYAEDTISFQVRVEAQPGTEFLNKADLKWWFDGNMEGSIPYSFLSDTAYSYVRYKVFLPDAPR